ncbi:MAG: DUF1801 domain-containing protein [Anaerolineae bacterium]|nr:DUF1801 domain-containing protein [Anaerolineae bacterium]
MDAKQATAEIDAYIAAQPDDVQAILREMRRVIREAAPQAEEVMTYGVPGFRQKKNLVQYGAFTQHIGFYPTPAVIEAFAEQLSPYKTSKGAIQFPLSQPIPYDLVREIVKYRVQQVVSGT